jgi:hypothetical protein
MKYYLRCQNTIFLSTQIRWNDSALCKSLFGSDREVVIQYSALGQLRALPYSAQTPNLDVKKALARVLSLENRPRGNAVWPHWKMYYIIKPQFVYC